MKTLCIHSLHQVYGGKQEQKAPAPTGCPYCDGELDFEQGNTATDQGFFDTQPGWGASIGSTLGSKFGIPGSLIGSAVGHYAETRDYTQMGEDYKNQIDMEIRKGNIPAD